MKNFITLRTFPFKKKKGFLEGPQNHDRVNWRLAYVHLMLNEHFLALAVFKFWKQLQHWTILGGLARSGCLISRFLFPFPFICLFFLYSLSFAQAGNKKVKTFSNFKEKCCASPPCVALLYLLFPDFHFLSLLSVRSLSLQFFFLSFFRTVWRWKSKSRIQNRQA